MHLPHAKRLAGALVGLVLLCLPAVLLAQEPADEDAEPPPQVEALCARGQALRERLGDAGTWARDAREVRRFEYDLRLARAALQDYAAVFRGRESSQLESLAGQAALRSTGLRLGSGLPTPDLTALPELAQLKEDLDGLAAVRTAAASMAQAQRDEIARGLERVLSRLDSLVRASPALAQARAQLFIASRQNADGSFSSGWSRSWDNTHVRIPTTAMALAALRGMNLRAGGQPEAGAVAYIAANVGLSAQDLKRRGERFVGNNVEPYSLAYSLWATLDQLEQARPGTPRHAALRGYAETLVGRIAATSWRYSDNPASVGTFQLALLGRSLRRAEAAGLRLPRRQDPDSAAAAVIASVASPQGHLAAAFAGAAQQADGGVLGAIYRRLEASRDPASGGFPYYVGRPTTAESSAFRSPFIEYVLYQAGRSNQARLRAAVQRFMDNREDFERAILAPRYALLPGWHDLAHHSWADYYYPFGMHGTALILEELQRLGDPSARQTARTLLRKMISQQAPDGSWRFSPFYGHVTDTATFASTVAILRRVAGR